MTPYTTRAFYPRALTHKERSFTRWLIEHADVGEEERQRLLSQLDSATVTGMCGCGCASIDFAIDGVASEPGAPLHPFGDFIAKDKTFGVFVFSKNQKLAGVEIYSLDGTDTPSEFPAFENLEMPARKETTPPPDSAHSTRGAS